VRYTFLSALAWHAKKFKAHGIPAQLKFF
jgi:hypothetical protein